MHNQAKHLIVSGGNSAFYPLLNALVRSIHRSNLTPQYSIVMLDAGLTKAQITELETMNVLIEPLHFDSPEQRKQLRDRRWLLVNYFKPRLNELFPSSKTITFLDADTWVQTPLAFDYMMQVTMQDHLAICSQASRLQDTHITLRRHLFSQWLHRVEPRGILYKNGRKAKLPKRLLNTLIAKPVLNCGVYSLKTTAPHWSAWQKWQQRCLRYGRVFTSDQLSLALAVDQEQLPYEALPAICNYLDPPVWRFDRSQSLFTDRYVPYTPVSIVHLAGYQNKLDPSLTLPCIDENGEQHQRSLHYDAWLAQQSMKISEN